MKKRIVTVPHEILRKQSIDVELVKEVLMFTSDLEDTLKKKSNPKGVGLSAPQIGKNWNIFTTYLPKPQKDPESTAFITTFINPVILETSDTKTFGPDPKSPYLEGCLSIPFLYGPVPRFEWIRIGYTTAKGKYVEEVFEDFHARVVQHEYDHLKGILFTDYTLEYDLPLYEYRKNTMTEIENTIAKAF